MCQFSADTPGSLIGKTFQNGFEVSTKCEYSASSEMSADPNAPGYGSGPTSSLTGSFVSLSASTSGDSISSEPTIFS